MFRLCLNMTIYPMSWIATLVALLAMTFRHCSSILESPTTERNVYVRAERHNIDAALWNMT
ncbi:MAG: hypothetical protein K2N12_02825 [Helicobacter sp.]|nr:hypothetical protein [Helicobacter sp.]